MTDLTNEIARPSFLDLTNQLNSRLGGFELLRMMRRRLWMILLVMATGMTATALWLTHQVPLYTSTSAILLKSSELPSETVTPGPGVVTSTQVFTEAEVLRSRDFASRLADRLGLMSDPRFNPALVEPVPPTLIERILFRFGLSEPDDARDISEERQHAEVLAKLLDLYAVSASEQHNVIDIRAQHVDPVLTAQIANETARLYMDMQAADQIGDLDRDIRFMRQRSEEIAANLLLQQTRITSLTMENQLLDDGAVHSLLAEQTNLRNRLEVVDANDPSRDALWTQIAEIEMQLADRVGAEIELEEHRTALRTETSRLDAINKRLDELEAQRDSPSPSVRHISVAEVPSNPSGPNMSSTLAAAFVVFGSLAVVGVLLRENLDSRVLYKEHAESLTGLNVLASLERLPRRLLRRHRTPHACVARDASPGFSNAVRALVSAATEGAQPGRASIVFVGSAKSGEGKSSVAASMAIAAAMDDLRVLLIDFDVHRFGLTRGFGLPLGTIAFGDVISERETLAAAILKTEHLGVYLLNFRPGSKMSRRALLSDGAQDAIEAMRHAFDLVIIDTPPLLASEEASRLHGIVDKAILVSRWGEVDQDTLAQTARLMRRSGLPVIGLAINAINPRAAHSYGFLTFCNAYYRSKEPSNA